MDGVGGVALPGSRLCCFSLLTSPVARLPTRRRERKNGPFPVTGSCWSRIVAEREMLERGKGAQRSATEGSGYAAQAADACVKEILASFLISDRRKEALR